MRLSATKAIIERSDTIIIAQFQQFMVLVIPTLISVWFALSVKKKLITERYSGN